MARGVGLAAMRSNRALFSNPRATSGIGFELLLVSMVSTSSHTLMTSAGKEGLSAVPPPCCKSHIWSHTQVAAHKHKRCCNATALWVDADIGEVLDGPPVLRHQLQEALRMHGGGGSAVPSCKHVPITCVDAVFEVEHARVADAPDTDMTLCDRRWPVTEKRTVKSRVPLFRRACDRLGAEAAFVHKHPNMANQCLCSMSHSMQPA